MEQKSIPAVIGILIGLILGIYFVADILTSGGNNLAAFARLLLIGSFVASVVSIRFGAYLLIIYGGYTDLLKRFMVLDISFSYMDIAWILSLPLVLVSGMIIGRFLRTFSRRELFGRWDWITLGFAVAACGISVIGVLLRSGFSLQNIQLAANLGAYTFLPFLAMGLFRSPGDLNRYLRFAVIVLIPCALHGIKQWLVGFSGFEIDYLKSNMTSLAAQLGQESPRPFATVANPGSFAVVCFFGFLVCCLSLGRPKNTGAEGESVEAILPKLFAILLGLVYLTALISSRVRSVWVAVMLAIVLWYSFRQRWTTIAVYLGVLVVFLVMVTYSKVILDENLLSKWSSSLIEWTGGSSFSEQAFQLQTWAERLKGYRDVLSNPSEWPLFGDPARRDQMVIHDDLSRLLYTVGAIPTGIIMVFGVSVIWWVHRTLIRRTEDKWSRNCASFGMATFVALLLRSIVAGYGAQVFPSNLIMYLCFMITVVMVARPEWFSSVAKNGEELETAEDPGEAMMKVG